MERERERERKSLVGQEKHRDQTEIVFINKENTVFFVALLFRTKDLKMTVATAAAPGASFFKL